MTAALMVHTNTSKTVHLESHNAALKGILFALQVDGCLVQQKTNHATARHYMLLLHDMLCSHESDGILYDQISNSLGFGMTQNGNN